MHLFPPLSSETSHWKLEVYCGGSVYKWKPSNITNQDSLSSLKKEEVKVKSLSHVRFFATPWTAARQASLSITNSQSSPKPMSTESVMQSNLLILCRPFLFPPSVFPSIRVFSSESVFRIRWPEYWSFSFSISPSNEHSELISFRIDWFALQSKGRSRVFSNTTVRKHQLFGAQLSLWSNSHIHTWLLEKP